jgi:hypothetical protein
LSEEGDGGALMDQHTAIRQLLSAYLDDRVTPQERREVEAHLASCQRCSGALAELAKTIGHLRNLDRVEPPPWLTGRIMARVREQAAKERVSIIRRLFFPLQIKLPLEAVALVFLTVTSYLLIRTMEPELATVGAPAETRHEQQAPAAPAPAPRQYIQPAPAQPVVREPAKAIEDKAAPVRQADSYLPERKSALPAAPAAELKQEAALPQAPAPPAAIGFSSDSMGARPAADAKLARGRDVAAPGSPQQSMQGPAYGGAAREAQRAEAPAARAKSSVATPVRGGEITLIVRDTSVATMAIEQAARELGGRIVNRASSATSRSMVVAIDSRRQPEFLDRLGRLGEVRGKPVILEQPAGEQLLTIKLLTVAP